MKTNIHRAMICMAAVAIITLSASQLFAEIVVPEGSTTQVSLVSVEQVVAHHKQRQELIVQAGICIGDTGGTIDRLAFIIPVPSVPDTAVLENPRVVRDMVSFERRLAGPSEKHVDITGDYVLKAITRNPGDPPISELLNKWLAANGFETLDAADLKYYDDNDWSFVIQRVYPGTGQTAGLLQPVRISFSSRRIVFPMQRMLAQRPKNASIYLLTKNSVEINDLAHFGFNIRTDNPLRTQLHMLPESVETVLARAGETRPVFREFRRRHIHLAAANGDFSARAPEADTMEVQINAPRFALISLVQNVLAVAAALIIVVMMNRRRKKNGND